MTPTSSLPGADAQTLGAYIKACREHHGLTQDQLAGRIGVSKSAVYQWEADEKTPSARGLHFIDEVLPACSSSRLLALVPRGRDDGSPRRSPEPQPRPSPTTGRAASRPEVTGTPHAP